MIELGMSEHVRRIEAHLSTVFCVVFTPDGKSLVTSGADGAVKMWDIASGSLKRTFEGHGDSVDGVAVSPIGALLLTGCNDRIARLWDLETGELKQSFPPRRSIIRRVRFSHDGRYFLVSSWDGKSRVHDTETGRLVVITSGGGDSADSTRDNRFLATVGYNDSAHVFRVDLDASTMKQAQRVRQLIRRFEDDDYAIREAAFAEIVKIGLPAEPLLRAAMQSKDAEVRIRARRARAQIRSPTPIAELSGHAGDVEFVRFSPDGKRLATGCRGGDLKIWTVPDCKEVITLRAPRKP